MSPFIELPRRLAVRLRQCLPNLRLRADDERPPQDALAAEVGRRRAAEAELRAANQTFEQRLRDRTRALEHVNLALWRRQEHLTHLALHDSLTGLPNRMLFHSLLRQEQVRAARLGGRFALLLADLDRFKPINDQHGHAAGDLLLVQVARRMAGAVRASDIVARLGGDEFAILMREPGDDAALAILAARVAEAVAAPCVVDGRQVDVGVSIGAAIYPDDGEDMDLLLQRADRDLYLAKNGRATRWPASRGLPSDQACDAERLTGS